jgi:hypothetical protein
MHRRRVLIVAALVAQIELVVAAVAMTIVALVVTVIGVASLQLPLAVRSLFVGSLGAIFIGPFAVFVFQLVRALRRPRPSGFRADPRTCRDLLAAISETTRLVGTRTPDGVFITAGFETVVIADGPRGYSLVIGLPVLDVLDDAETRTRISVSLWRAFGGDPVTARAYRMGARLASILEAASPTGGTPTGVALRIAVAGMKALDLSTVLPEREAYARREAERTSGITKLRRALLRPAMYEQSAQTVFWPGLVQRHAANSEPPDAMSQLRARCRAPLSAADAPRLLNLATAGLSLDDPDAAALPVPQRPASDVLLSNTAGLVTAAFDTIFRAAFTPQWAQLRQTTIDLEAELDQLERSAQGGALEPDAAWRRLELIEERRGAAAALPLYREWILTHPADGRALFNAGRCALAQREDDAIALLASAMATDERYAVDANLMIAAELTARGQLAEAATYQERHEAALAVQQAVLIERGKWDRTVSLLPHGLAAHEVAVVVARLREFPAVASATLARKRVEHVATLPCIVVGVRFRRLWYWSNTEKIQGMLNRIAEVPLPIQFLVINLSAGGWSAKILSHTPAVEIYRAERLPWRARLAGWGRKAQLVLVASGIFLIVVVGVLNRDCFPGCWDATAVFLLTPIIVAVNALLLARAPDTSARRAVAFVASAFFAGMYFFGGSFVLLFPVAVTALMRTPTSARPMIWALGMGIPAFTLGWLVTTI